MRGRSAGSRVFYHRSNAVETKMTHEMLCFTIETGDCHTPCYGGSRRQWVADGGTVPITMHFPTAQNPFDKWISPTQTPSRNGSLHSRTPPQQNPFDKGPPIAENPAEAWITPTQAHLTNGFPNSRIHATNGPPTAESIRRTTFFREKLIRPMDRKLENILITKGSESYLSSPYFSKNETT